MNLLSELLLLEADPDPAERRRALKLQQELIERLPDDYDVSLASADGEIAVKVKHSSYTGTITGPVFIFRVTFPVVNGAVKLVFTPKEAAYERELVYGRNELDILARDLQGNIQKNEL